jgi:hypothetical protein
MRSENNYMIYGGKKGTGKEVGREFLRFYLEYAQSD